ncbi:hypothetical protein V8C34DRAFT_294133 [Trichoderma compactum]
MQRIEDRLCGPDKQSLAGVTRDEFLWFLRTEHEEHHRWHIRHYAVQYTYRASPRDVAANCLPDLSDYHWADTCNKSVPVYIVPGQRWLLLRVVLHNYIYRRWFRPYRSEIDYGRFICKFIYPCPPAYEEPMPPPTIHDIITINQAICAKIEEQRSIFVEEYNSHGRFAITPTVGKSPAQYILQPLFRALLIVVSDKKYNKETSETVGGLPVYLVRTGIEEGLSAPISFEPIATKTLSHIEAGHVIEVTIETAIDFIMELEAREVAAFGFRPDPVSDWKPFEDDSEAWQSLGETEPLVGPNSQWVDSEKYPQWAGSGKDCYSNQMSWLEEQQFRLQVAFERSREEHFARQAAAESAANKKSTG